MIRVDDAWAVFAVIFLAEFGDKTFFVAMLLATKFNPFIVFIGCMMGLLLSTTLAVGIGYGAAQFLSQPVLNIIAAGTFLLFAIITFWELPAAEGHSAGTIEEATEKIRSMSSIADIFPELERLPRKESYAGGEDVELPKALVNSDPSKLSALSVLWTVAVSEFVGEVGDRTQIACILLEGNFPWYVVLIFAMLAFVVVTAIAIVAGQICAKYLNERVVGLCSGTVFLVFGILSLVEAIGGKDIW